ncbi:hypothetical protein [Guptibacillus algicola]|uniref:hypothetical protein n=1 Tax=Guptibacillus algicola TaxID=225844 RepID=UPI001CD55AF8|nr:hypothetical protein [Alkalihalobacillus algicola]MCA0987194.1 hypothetical protein [Alkalihalobacillus algicola]
MGNRLKLWAGAVIMALIAFFITKLFWSEVPTAFLLVYLLIGYLVIFFLTLIVQSKKT